MRVWNLRTGECTQTLQGHTHAVWYVAFDGTTIVSGSTDKTVRIWRAPYNRAECKRVLNVHTKPVHRVWLCTAPNARIVVSVELFGRVHVHDVRTGDLV